MTKQLEIHRKFNESLRKIFKEYPTSEILINQIVIYEKIIQMKSHLAKKITDHIGVIKNKNRKVIFSKKVGKQAS